MATILRCGRRRKNCSKCGHKFTKAEYDRWTCPECRTDRHCQAVVTRPGAACRFHGGRSLKGIASPTWKDGGYSRYLPTSMLADHQAFASDSAYLQLSNEIHLTRTLLAERLRALTALEQAHGPRVETVRGEVITLIEQERRLVESAVKEQARLGEFITRGIALAMFSRFLEVVKQNVSTLPGGPGALRSIADAIVPMVGGMDSGGPSGGG